MPDPQTSLTDLSVAVDQDPDQLPHTELATALEREHRTPVWRARLFWGLIASLGLAIIGLAIFGSDTPFYDPDVSDPDEAKIFIPSKTLDELRTDHTASPCDAKVKEELHRRLVLDGLTDEAIELNHRFAVDCAVDSPP